MFFLLVLQKIRFFGILGPPYCGIGATISIGQKMPCLPYAVLFHFHWRKLGGVVPVKTEPPPPSSKTLEKETMKRNKSHVTHDTWDMTFDKWHATYEMMWHLTFDILGGVHFLSNGLREKVLKIFDRPGVAGTVVQTALWLTNQLSHSLWKYLQNTVSPKP